jgi:hypothetical protein
MESPDNLSLEELSYYRGLIYKRDQAMSRSRTTNFVTGLSMASGSSFIGGSIWDFEGAAVGALLGITYTVYLYVRSKLDIKACQAGLNELEPKQLEQVLQQS